ncbi:class I SAM-dependent methyltransferase [bacterium NHP-B]|nr:class I SAM-dependent methyltransferase [bacterium NHP-B]
MSVALSFHPSSFRDPEGRLFIDGQNVKRKVFSAHAAERMQRLVGSPFFQKACEGLVIPTHMHEDVLVHEKVPVASYPYEWSFSMLKEAALGQLRFLRLCLENGFILKDGSAFNTLYHKGQMCFVDILSVDDYREGQIYEGYGQFCRHFLFPLFLEAKVGVSFQSFWRGTLDGVSLDDISACIGSRQPLSLDLLKHVRLQKWLSGMASKASNKKRSYAMPRSSLHSFVDSLIKTVTSLHPQKRSSMWSDYATCNTYEEADQKVKEGFLIKHVPHIQNKCVVDLGCNTGHYTCLLAPFAKRIIAVDYDACSIDRLYRRVQQDERLSSNVLPMVGHLMNPSPMMGWTLREREDQLDRLTSDAFLALALVHHVAITENVPLEMFVAFLRSVAPMGCVEWVSKEDPMVKTLLRNRRDIFDHYTWDHFRACLQTHFVIKDEATLNQGTRRLVWVEAKP